MGSQWHCPCRASGPGPGSLSCQAAGGLQWLVAVTWVPHQWWWLGATPPDHTTQGQSPDRAVGTQTGGNEDGVEKLHLYLRYMFSEKADVTDPSTVTWSTSSQRLTS